MRGVPVARGERSAGEVDSEGVLHGGQFTDAARVVARPELESGATSCGLEDERRVPDSDGDVNDLSLAWRFFLRKLDGSSRERVEDEDWSSSSSGGCDDGTLEGEVGDMGDCTIVPSAEPNFLCLASRSCSLSFALAEKGLVRGGATAMSPTPTVFSHKFPMRPLPATVAGHL